MSLLISKILQNLDSLNGVSKIVADIILRATNDWPEDIKTLEDYVKQIEQFINDETTLFNIKKVQDYKDPLMYSWELESLFQIEEIFNYFDTDLSLKQIISIFEKNNFS